MGYLPRSLRQGNGRHGGRGGIDIHVSLLEFAPIDVHATDGADLIAADGLAQIELVVLIEPPELVIATAAVEHEIAVVHGVILAKRKRSQRIPQGLPETHRLAPVIGTGSPG